MLTKDLEPWVRAAGLDSVGFPSTVIDAGEPVYATPLGVREGATTVLALIGEAVSDIWCKQTGRRQEVRVDTQHAEVAMASSWTMKVDGELATSKFPEPLSAIEGPFPCADGKTIYFLCAFPSLVNATVETLGCDLATESIRAATSSRPSQDIEESMNARGLNGVIVRDHETWLQHPQGQALANQPAVHFERFDDAPVTPLPRGDRPLTGLKVVDMTRVLAGPTIGRTLAEFGAEVLHLASPDLVDIISGQIDTAHGKRRAFARLDRPDEMERVRALCADADVFVQAFRADSFARRGLGPNDLAKIRPGIVYVSESAYGNVGPWRAKRGFDGSVQAACGIQLLHPPKFPPGFGAHAPLPMAINDYGTGYWGAYGVLEALRRRAQVGGSWHVRVSLAQTATWFMRMGSVRDPKSGMSAGAAWSLVDSFSEDAESAYGRITRLRPVIQLAETPAAWKTPTVRPGTHDCSWA